MSIRIHELAKRHGMEGRDMLALLKELKFVAADTKSVSSIVSKIYEEELDKYMAGKKNSDSLSPDVLAKRLERLPRRLRMALALRQALRFLPLTAPDGIFPPHWKATDAIKCIHACLAVLRSLATEDRTTEVIISVQELFSKPTLARGFLVKLASALTEVFNPQTARNLASLLSVDGLLIHYPTKTGGHILADVAFCEEAARLAKAESTAIKTAMFGLFTHPLWDDDAPSKPPSPQPFAWAKACINLAGTDENSRHAKEMTRLLEIYNGLYHGRPDWEAILGPEAYRQALPFLPLTPSAPPTLSPGETGTVIARLAFLDSSALGLVSTPSIQGLNQVLDAKEPADPANPLARLIRITDAAGDFAPDPLWLTWFQVTKTEFSQAVCQSPAASDKATSGRLTSENKSPIKQGRDPLGIHRLP